MRADLKALADIVIQTFKAKLGPVVARLDALDQVVKALPETVALGLEDRVQKAVDAIPRPADGKDFPAEEVQRMVADAVATIPPAKDGQDGKSVTVDDLGPVVNEAVSKAVALIPTPKDGESVPVDQVQKMVDEAVAKALAAVPPAKDGLPGRDALQMELQPCIEEDRTYPRGTYAKHAGGLWRAFEATKGMHGWECIVDGIADLRIEQTGREFTLITRTSSGAEVSKSVKVAALVDRGVFKAGTDYEQGDGVTWAGSFFIAQKDGPAGKPGEPGSDGWRLAVKRGRDASSGVAVHG